MTELLRGVLWTEKYRPRKLEDMAMEEENLRLFQSYIEAGEIPHLLLMGPPGSGKTTVARILCSALDCQVMLMNASSERGIDVVRDKIATFVTGRILAKWNVVFLDEADAITADAQTALRNLIESYASHSRFILSGNYAHKIIGPIQSRCMLIHLSPPPLKERFRILQSVLEQEGIKAELPVVLSYAERFPDMRKMLMAAQRAYLSSPTGTLPSAVQEAQTGGVDILKMMRAKNWAGIRRLTTSGSFDPQQALRDVFWSIPDDDGHVGMLRHIIGKGVHESGWSPDPIVHFLGVTAEAMEGL